MSSRLLNKMLFFHYGTMDVLERACRDLTSGIQLYLDDRLVELPSLEGRCVRTCVGEILFRWKHPI
jgi:hypothetical protein